MAENIVAKKEAAKLEKAFDDMSTDAAKIERLRMMHAQTDGNVQKLAFLIEQLMQHEHSRFNGLPVLSQKAMQPILLHLQELKQNPIAAEMRAAAPQPAKPLIVRILERAKVLRS